VTKLYHTQECDENYTTHIRSYQVLTSAHIFKIDCFSLGIILDSKCKNN